MTTWCLVLPVLRIPLQWFRLVTSLSMATVKPFWSNPLRLSPPLELRHRSLPLARLLWMISLRLPLSLLGAALTSLCGESTFLTSGCLIRLSSPIVWRVTTDVHGPRRNRAQRGYAFAAVGSIRRMRREKLKIEWGKAAGAACPSRPQRIADGAMVKHRSESRDPVSVCWRCAERIY